MNLLPEASRVRIRVTGDNAQADDAGSIDHLIIFLPQRVAATTLRDVAFSDSIKAIRHRAPNKKAILRGALLNDARVGVTIATLGKSGSAFARMTLAREAFTAAASFQSKRIGVQFLEPQQDERDAMAAAATAAAFAHSAPMPVFKTRTPKPNPLRSVVLFGALHVDLNRIRIENDANALARWLSALPPNVLTARTMRDAALQVAKDQGWEATVYDELTLDKMGAHAFLAVARGNEHSDASIVHLHRAGAKDGKHLSLVGKGVCYDTGGINVKPANYMNGMQEDMQGSAVALGSCLALSQLAPELTLDCWLAITENRINGNAYTPNEVIRAINGTTIEIIHSDAEGRMALADTLVLASRAKPQLIVDFATLTGSCVSALTTRYSGVFCNRPHLNQTLIDAGVASGERVWPFPIDADFDKDIDSAQADVKQCRISGGGDHILAARFLAHFVDADIPWVHMDLSSGNHKGGLADIPTDVTGFGVRTTVSLILDHDQPDNT